jgi:hypothetical protein
MQTLFVTMQPGFDLAIARTPTLRPFGAPWPVLVAVSDTNTLATQACNAVRAGLHSELFNGLARTGRSNTFAAAHVPDELALRLVDVAASMRVGLAEAERRLWDKIMPVVPVVDLAMGDYLHPRLKPLLNTDLNLPRRLRGDPDDLGTAALAEFLAPAIIISADSVFTRLGLSNTTALTCVAIARRFLRAAGVEATIGDAAFFAEMAVRLLGAGIVAVVRAAGRRPVTAVLLLAALAYLAGRYGYFNLDRWRDGGRRLSAAVQSHVDRFSDHIGDLLGTAAADRQALFVIEPYGPAMVEQTAARFLARCGRPLTPGELRDALPLAAPRLPAAKLRRAMMGHPAFRRLPGDRYTIGRIAQWP